MWSVTLLEHGKLARCGAYNAIRVVGRSQTYMYQMHD